MKTLYKLRLRQFLNRMKHLGFRHYLLFFLFGSGILVLLGLFFVKVFGYLYYEEEFPLAFKLFIAEKIMLMVFLTLFSMLVLSALISSLNIFFLSKDLRLLFSSPLKTGTVFSWKSIEVGINSGIMVLFFCLPVLLIVQRGQGQALRVGYVLHKQCAMAQSSPKKPVIPKHGLRLSDE